MLLQKTVSKVPTSVINKIKIKTLFEGIPDMKDADLLYEYLEKFSFKSIIEEERRDAVINV